MRGTKNTKATLRVTKEQELYRLAFAYDPAIVTLVRSLPGRVWLPDEKIWTVPRARIDEASLQRRLGSLAELVFDSPDDASARESTEIEDELRTCREHLQRRRYSRHTVKNYLHHIRQYLHSSSRATSADDEAIITYVNQISSSGEYSSSYQNVAVNAIKFYTETVCGKSMPKIKLRPRREKKLPLILAESEVAAIIGALENTKHRAVISLIYSGGLRVSEAVNLKIQDFDRERGLIRIVQAKGKKDRQVPLSARLWELLKRYRQEYQPRTWLFEGQKGGQYTVRSIQALFQRACKTAGITKPVTPLCDINWLDGKGMRTGIRFRINH
ncbi:hypothetical protein AU468_09540 [Alkalispirochaeta sphaeroplastigenens]|uniref:Integrase n=1 Tax=Alkalispirochaeta sphaeroplastigenens TaxID=1187066 RepID=A0A2S4JM35_9SPIO|nr:tyrosine-type recombinase/integrase [Alkalispirochaeta sphaeroplastigenens]POR00579.1 hypothetical protein AU468_09540 [Alkalispirochaeta sphaeroplastigenens]